MDDVDVDDSYVLRPGVSVHQDPHSRLTIQLPSKHLTVSGRSADVAGKVLRALDVARTVQEIVRETGERPDTVARTLRELAAKGVIVSSGTLDRGWGVDRRANAALTLLARDVGPGTELAHTPTSILFSGDEDLCECFEQILRRNITCDVRPGRTFGQHSRSARAETVPDLHVHLSRERDDEGLRDLDRSSRSREFPYFAGWLENLKVVLTPLVVPGRGACYRCLCVREEAASACRNESSGRVVQAAPVRLPACDGLLPGLAAVRAISCLEPFRDSSTATTLVEIDCRTLTSTHHPVLRVPMCEGCGGGT